MAVALGGGARETNEDREVAIKLTTGTRASGEQTSHQRLFFPLGEIELRHLCARHKAAFGCRREGVAGHGANGVAVVAEDAREARLLQLGALRGRKDAGILEEEAASGAMQRAARCAPLAVGASRAHRSPSRVLWNCSPIMHAKTRLFFVVALVALRLPSVEPTRPPMTGSSTMAPTYRSMSSEKCARWPRRDTSAHTGRGVVVGECTPDVGVENLLFEVIERLGARHAAEVAPLVVGRNSVLAASNYVHGAQIGAASWTTRLRLPLLSTSTHVPNIASVIAGVIR